MGRAGVLQGVRQMRFEGLLERHERGELSQEEAAEMLGVSEWTFGRWRDRLRDEGPQGLRDRRIGKPSSRRAAAEEILRMLRLYRERYEGFTVKHCREQLQKRPNYKLGYTVTRLARCGRISCAPRCVYTNTRTGGLAIFHGPGLPATCVPWKARLITSNWLHEPLRQPACGFVDDAARCLQPTGPTTTKAVN